MHPWITENCFAILRAPSSLLHPYYLLSSSLPQHRCPIKFTLFMHSTMNDDFLISIKVSGCLYTVSNLPMACWSALALSMPSPWPHLVHCTRSDDTLYVCGQSYLREFNLWLRPWRGLCSSCKSSLSLFLESCKCNR